MLGLTFEFLTPANLDNLFEKPSNPNLVNPVSGTRAGSTFSKPSRIKIIFFFGNSDFFWDCYGQNGAGFLYVILVFIFEVHL